ncbi:MAG: tetratricopeptide repeat protein [archaeon]|nr:tetratricopeptide repeat protein [archaeon]
MRYKSITDAVGGEMEASGLEDLEEIDTIIAELEISQGKGNVILCVVNSPAYREKIIQVLQRRFSTNVISVETGEQIIRTLKEQDFKSVDVLIWIMPEEPTEDLLNTLNNFRELFYDAKIPNLMFYNQAFSEEVIRKALDFWRYRGNYYELKEAERGMAFEALETLATPFSYQDKEDLLRRKRINEYLLERVRDKEEKADILLELGVIFYYSGDLDKALEYYEKALELNDELGMKEGIAAVFGNIGAVYFTKGELDKALQYFEKALKLNEELGNKKGMANQLGNMGVLYFTKGELDKASGSYKKALKIFEESGIKEGIATLLGNIGALYFTKGEPDKALEYLRRILGLHDEFGSKESLAKNFENIGVVYSAKGELNKALEYYEKALKIFEEMGSRIETAKTKVNIGDIFAQKGDKERALEYYREAKDLAAGSYVFEFVSKRIKELKE